MTIKRWIGVTVLLGLFWLFRSFLPFMFFSDAGIEVILNVPASVKQPTIYTTYKSFSCDYLSLYDLSWQSQKMHNPFETNKMSETQYKVKIPYSDHSPCSWRLQSLGWSLDLKDASIIDPRVPAENGGGAGIGIKIVYEPENWLNLYQDGVFVIDDEIIPRISNYVGPHHPNVHVEPEFKIFLNGRYDRKKLEYGTRDSNGHEKIIYNATINLDKLIDESE
ncbi:MAG: hypothetical protein JKY74_02270 [Shewanella sp.]|nr:hypothetical protein [Shewanella sp.]